MKKKYLPTDKKLLSILVAVSVIIAQSAFAVINITPSATTPTPASIDRFGTNLVTLSTTFEDTDLPALNLFFATFKVRSPFNEFTLVIADSIQNGVGGLTITDDGGGFYTASINWDPADNITLGLYDLYFSVTNGTFSDTDLFTSNLNELTIANGGENSIPIVQSDAVFASPAGVERIGVNTITFAADFYDPDIPGVNAFTVNFKLRHPDNLAETILTTDAANGTQGVTITDNGAGSYTASVSWDPPDIQTIGFYDLYFDVSDGLGSTFDDYANNTDEMEIFDAISNNPPTVIAGAVFTIPTSVNRIGSEFITIKADFADTDIPSSAAFTITISVQDNTNTTYTLVNAAKDGEQGLRVKNIGGANFAASYIWDPSDLQVTGPYDLFFEVSDQQSATATDGYANNTDELTITSSAPAGDGNLLRRSHVADNCGGVNSACHNVQGHQGQDCLVCHSSHDVTNIYLIKDSIQTPNSGLREVIFKTLGIGDPFNAPDPTVGDPTSGVMADASDGVGTGVCEVCHTTTTHHRNDGSQLPDSHNDAQDCTQCHVHTDGFKGGESGGGLSCSTCHSQIYAAMDSTSILARHILGNDSADYSPGASGMFTIKNCLSCHVDHDIFRPDLNPGIGTRGSNLRVDWAIDPVSGDNTVLLNSDYQSTGNGGVCLSCHDGSDPTCSACHSAHTPPKDFLLPFASASSVHRFIPKAEYDSAISTHNYSVPITFTTDGSVFNANCTKCHNDDMSKTYQNSTVKVSIHGSSFSLMLDSTGIAAPTEPLEEAFCFKCHSTTSNPNAGVNLDYFGIKGMGAPTLGIEAEFGLPSTHPVGSFSGIHSPIDTLGTTARHVECADCHNPHAATSDNPPSPALNGALFGVNGVDIDGAEIRPVVESYQVCLKCHGDSPGTTAYVQRNFVNLNTRDEFKPTSQSFHPVAAVGTNTNVPSLIAPLTETSRIDCQDCHSAPVGGSAGPHGSDFTPILKMRYETADFTPESAANYALCYSCHDRSSILNDVSFKEHDRHIRREDTPCSGCHDSHGVANTPQGDGTHLINFDVSYCTPSSSGRLEFIDLGNQRGECYVTCHGKDHDPKSY